MYFDGEFRKIADCDISDLASMVMKISEEKWLEEDVRQKKFDVHKQTQTIKLLHDNHLHGDPIVYSTYSQYKQELKPVLLAIKRKFDSQLKYQRLQKKNGKGYFVRVLLTRLSSLGEIPRHQDTGNSLPRCHRIHMPLVTNEKVYFHCGGVEKCLKPGEVWEINNRKAHAVRNTSSENRIHLIMDYVVPGEKVADPEGELIC